MLDKYTDINKYLSNIREPDPWVFTIKVLEIFKREKYTDFLILDENFPLLRSVAKGSEHPPIVLMLNASKFLTAHSILIGKGITFDSGGIQSKGDAMDGMFFDKLGATLTISYCMLNSRVPGLVFFASNVVGPHALLPGEIITSYSGKKILISHTDAEGRLGLADLIAYAEKKNKKAHKVTVATLTGSASNFTSDNTYALLHTELLSLKMQALCNSDQVELFPAPLHKEYKKALKTGVFAADMQSCGEGLNGGGSMTAYYFLKAFSKRLTHVDMAAMGVKNDNATGWGLREIDFIIEHLTDEYY